MPKVSKFAWHLLETEKNMVRAIIFDQQKQVQIEMFFKQKVEKKKIISLQIFNQCSLIC